MILQVLERSLVDIKYCKNSDIVKYYILKELFRSSS